VENRLSCPAAWGIFLDRGRNLRPLHWQADSQPLDHQGSPKPHFKTVSNVLFSRQSGGSQSLAMTSVTWGILLFSHSVVSDSATPGLQHARLLITSSRSLLELMSIESVMPSNHLILCCPLLLLLLIFPSIRVFSQKSSLCIRWSKYWSFSIILSNEYSVLISFRIDWFDVLSVQGSLKSLLQHHSSKASILRLSPAPFTCFWVGHPCCAGT